MQMNNENAHALRKAIESCCPKIRRRFIWREKREDLFIVVVSEFLLRKTRAEKVDTFLRTVFLKRFTSFQDVTCVTEESLSKLLAPLGLHRVRAHALKVIAEALSGELSEEEILNKLPKLPHVGKYITNAVALFHYNRRVPLVDKGIMRVLHRFAQIEPAAEVHKADYLWKTVRKLMPQTNYVEFMYCFLDFAAVVCKPRNPNCNCCPASSYCVYYTTSKTSTTSSQALL